MVTRLFTIFLLRNLYFQAFREVLEMQLRGKGCLFVSLWCSFLCLYWAAFVSSQLLTVEGQCLYLPHKYVRMSQYKPAAQSEISPSNFFPSKIVFTAAVSTRMDSWALPSLLAAVFACSIEGWTRNGSVQMQWVNCCRCWLHHSSR